MNQLNVEVRRLGHAHSFTTMRTASFDAADAAGTDATLYNELDSAPSATSLVGIDQYLRQCGNLVTDGRVNHVNTFTYDTNGPVMSAAVE
jgi:hypothetical protein